MGCGGSKKERVSQKRNSRDSSTDGYDRRPRISVRIGPQVKLDHSPTIIFIFGGPGSRKGCIVDDLLTAHDLKHICTEEILYQELPKKLAGVMKIETVNDMKEAMEADSSHVTLEWILEIISSRIEQDPSAKYLVDFIPNLKYMLKAQFLQENCCDALEKFEKKYPISFGLNLAVPADKILTSKQIFCATASSFRESGGKGDEADSAKLQSPRIRDDVDSDVLQRRAALYEQSSKHVIDYFASTERLITVDVTCGVAGVIWQKVHQVLCQLSFFPKRTVNTVLLFTFDEDDEKLNIDYQKYLLEKIYLQRIVENASESTVECLLNELATYVNNNSKKTDSFVVDAKGTALCKNNCRKASQKAIVFTEIKEGYLETFLPGNPKNYTPKSDDRKYKAVCSLENEICLFPLNTSDELCTTIALHLAKIRRL